jgi:alpha-L-fucosidase
MAGAAVAGGLPGMAQVSAGAKESAFGSFDTYTEDYAAFCAKPADARVFYALVNGKIVAEKLDEATWVPVPGGWGKPPELPVPGGSWDGVPLVSPISNLAGSGPYGPTWDSLLEYDAPEWYRDAKFGIWAHWDPQNVPEDGDWYARNMYVQGSAQNKYQLEHYGPPSRFGYKDLCAQWTMLNWDPDELMMRYKKAGAGFFIALANHHDGFDTWDSKYHEWNAVRVGPRRDIVGGWAAAARKQGLRFGVSVHQGRNWWWFQPAHGADKSGPLAGVSYDGNLTKAGGKYQWWEGLDPQQLYGVKHPANALPDISYVKNFYNRTRDLIDQHSPDQVYFDNALLPLGWAGMNLGAYIYNHNLRVHQGRMEAVISVGNVPPHLAKALIGGLESGVVEGIQDYPWQSETCIGGWHYQRKIFDKAGKYGGYMAPREVIHWLVDVVSKNGTFLLSIPGKPDGTLDSKEIAVLDGVTAWMESNSEAIHATRPWKVFGEGPNRIYPGQFQAKKDQSAAKLGVEDIRFTRDKANTCVYAIVLGIPEGPFVVKSLGTNALTHPGKVEHVQLLGTDEPVRWKQVADGLHLEMPKHYEPATDYAASFKVLLG